MYQAPPGARRLTTLRLYTMVASPATMATGILVMTGWMFDISSLKRLLPSMPAKDAWWEYPTVPAGLAQIEARGLVGNVSAGARNQRMVA